MAQLHLIRGDELTGAQVYAIWRIRDVVFAIEQQCDEPDPDGIDLRPSCHHLWFADAAGITSYLRTFEAEEGLRHIGRVATRRDARGQGLAGRLMSEVLTRWGDRELGLGAQAQLYDWYAGFGFRRVGDNYREAGIDHVPMRRDGAPSSGQPSSDRPSSGQPSSDRPGNSGQPSSGQPSSDRPGSIPKRATS